MKAITLKSFGPPENMAIGDWEKPMPGQGEILVKVHATAVNRADTLQRQGKYPPPKGASEIMGLELAGEVESLGPDCKKWKKGDFVCGLLPGGGYAEYAIIHENLALPIPKGLTIAEAAAIPEVFLTAFQAIDWLAKLKQGEKILIHAGASGVGTAGIQIAREKGAEIFITASAGKHAICQQLGANHTIDYKSKAFEEEVHRFTQGRGVNVIVDFIAAPYFQQNLNALSFDGRMVMLALMGSPKTNSINLGPILRKRLKIMGSTLRARTLDYKIRLSEDLKNFAWPLFESGKLKPIIDTTFSWEDAAEAHHYMEANKNTGKIVLRIT
ncbi:NAD(P)H-quinone oxidoreductase [Flexithrix dorotheae]|uniref:NAD(P)H-quinone oxidoreductase n=1 Tax=Flexithrix dorotheae TaxID=70993 RepID=UPI00035C2EE1|nr:NAD(P)H-quinone oxidoreductase [Flexithrix dorotheae]